MSLLTYYLEYGRHVARLHHRRRRRRAYGSTRTTAGHDNMRKPIHGFPLFPYMGMGLRLASLRAARAPLKKIGVKCMNVQCLFARPNKQITSHLPTGVTAAQIYTSCNASQNIFSISA